jgi:hypothetical protein
MGVDLSRQPNINPDGVSCVGESKPGKIGYMGYYFVYCGKGPEARAAASVKRIAKLHDDPAVPTDWTPAKTGREGFIQESKRLRDDGGHRTRFQNIADLPVQFSNPFVMDIRRLNDFRY